ncbi:hypothetical protein [Arthrobacter sp. PAMC25564]|nr:hypothetical protein [Arthrobacter sp. PAMC25564]
MTLSVQQDDHGAGEGADGRGGGPGDEGLDLFVVPVAVTAPGNPAMR